MVLVGSPTPAFHCTACTELYSCTACSLLQLLGPKLWSLGRVLPGVDVVRLVARSPRLLLVPSSRAVAILVEMVNALPGAWGQIGGAVTLY